MLNLDQLKRINLKRINWTNTLFLIGMHLVGIVGAILLFTLGHVHWQTWILTLIATILIGLTVTAGYHRLFAHRSYRAAWPIRLSFLLLGAAAFEGSVLEWATDHRNHHRYTDTDRDPYSIKRGFWHAHMGWLFTLDTGKRDYSNVDDLSADPLIRWQHKFFIPLAIMMSLVLPVGLAALWGDPLGGLVIAGALRIVINLQMTFCINSVCHLWGERTYSEEQSAVDQWFTALFTFGEGFHNFHHQFPIDYRNGVRLYDFDPTKWLIRSMVFLGLAQDLKRVTKEQIIRYRVKSDAKKIIGQEIQHQETQHPVLHALRDRILHMAVQVHQLEKDYIALKQQKLAQYRDHLRTQRERLKQMKQELKQSLMMWTVLVRQYKRKPNYVGI